MDPLKPIENLRHFIRFEQSPLAKSLYHSITKCLPSLLRAGGGTGGDQAGVGKVVEQSALGGVGARGACLGVTLNIFQKGLFYHL